MWPAVPTTTCLVIGAEAARPAHVVGGVPWARRGSVGAGAASPAHIVGGVPWARRGSVGAEAARPVHVVGGVPWARRGSVVAEAARPAWWCEAAGRPTPEASLSESVGVRSRRASDPRGEPE